MKKILKYSMLVSIIVFSPLVAFAQITTSAGQGVACTGNGLGALICHLQQLLNSGVPLLLALGVVYFVWGVVKFMIADGEEAKTKGKDQIVYSIIGFAVIIGMWGLVNLVVNTFSLGGQNAPSLSALTPSQIGNTSCSLASSPKFQDYLNYFSGCIINNSIIPFIFALAIVMFFWGVIKFFIINADEEAKREQGKQYMIWGIIALAVMLSVWGLVGILKTTFGLDTGASILPQVTPPK